MALPGHFIPSEHTLSPPATPYSAFTDHTDSSKRSSRWTEASKPKSLDKGRSSAASDATDKRWSTPMTTFAEPKPMRLSESQQASKLVNGSINSAYAAADAKSPGSVKSEIHSEVSSAVHEMPPPIRSEPEKQKYNRRDRPVSLNMDLHLPKSAQPSLVQGNGPQQATRSHTLESLYDAYAGESSAQAEMRNQETRRAEMRRAAARDGVQAERWYPQEMESYAPYEAVYDYRPYMNLYALQPIPGMMPNMAYASSGYSYPMVQRPYMQSYPKLPYYPYPPTFPNMSMQYQYSRQIQPIQYPYPAYPAYPNYSMYPPYAAPGYMPASMPVSRVTTPPPEPTKAAEAEHIPIKDFPLQKLASVTIPSIGAKLNQGWPKYLPSNVDNPFRGTTLTPIFWRQFLDRLTETAAQVSVDYTGRVSGEDEEELCAQAVSSVIDRDNNAIFNGQGLHVQLARAKKSRKDGKLFKRGEWALIVSSKHIQLE